MVDVPIDDEHPLSSVGQGGGGDRDVVEQAKAHGPGRAGVVPGWSDGHERGVAFPSLECVDGVQPAPRSPNGGLPGAAATLACLRSMSPPPAADSWAMASRYRYVVDTAQRSARPAGFPFQPSQPPRSSPASSMPCSTASSRRPLGMAVTRVMTIDRCD